MRVKAVFIQEFYREMGGHSMDLEVPDGITVRELIDYIDRRVKPGFKEMLMEGESLRYPVEIAVNGRRIDFLDGLDTVLKDGDRVLFSPRALFVL